jgi:anti-sigma factor RsiW
MNGPGALDGAHLDAEALDRYRRRAAAPAELLAADAHIASCNRCYAAVRAPDEAIGLPERHLAYEDLEAFVDGRADAIARELVTEHTANCTMCASELADIAAMRDSLAPRPNRPAEAVRRLPR